MELKIRKAKLSDNESIDRCNRMVLPENYDLKFYNYILGSDNSSSFVLEKIEDNKKEIVGYILTALQYNNVNHIIGHIISIGILDDYRRKGYGKKLIEFAEKDLKSKYNISYISLHVRKTNKAAIKFYHKMDFVKAKKIKEYYGKRQDAFLMKKDC